MKCKILRQLESTEEKKKVEKTRATVKDLHTRIRVAIHRIDTISKRIEELRDKELQPQLEELIEGYNSFGSSFFLTFCLMCVGCFVHFFICFNYIFFSIKNK